MRRKRIFFPDFLIVLVLAVSAGGAFALAVCASGELTAEGARPQNYFITDTTFDNVSKEAWQVVFSSPGVPVFGEAFLRLSETPNARRFHREKSAVSAAADGPSAFFQNPPPPLLSYAYSQSKSPFENRLRSESK